MDRSKPGTERPTPVERFKPTSGLFSGYVGLAMAMIVLAYVIGTERSVTGLQVALGAVFFGVLIWATQIRPRATVYADHVVLKNSFRDAYVPLVEVDQVAVGQTLNVWAGERRFVCIGIGSSLRHEMRAQRRRRVEGGTSRLGELEVRAERADTQARGTTYQNFVVTRLEELVAEAKREQQGDQESPVRRARQVTAWPEVGALAVSGVAFVISLFL